MRRMSHLNQHPYISKQFGRICTGPLVCFLAVEESHKCRSGPNFVFGSYLECLTEVYFDEHGFATSFYRQVFVCWIADFARRARGGGEKDHSTRRFGGFEQNI